jgi:TatD DNase family protein
MFKGCYSVVCKTSAFLCLASPIGSTSASFLTGIRRSQFARGLSSSTRSFISSSLLHSSRANLSLPARRTMSSSRSVSAHASLIDVDCNLWHDDLRSLQGIDTEDKLHILEEDAITDHRIQAMISPSSTIQEAMDGIERLKQYAGPLTIKTTVGVHPYHVDDDDVQQRGKSIERQIQSMRELLLANPSLCAAVGECGLDASDGFPPIADQLPWFQAQIELAQELQLPLFVHERLAFEACMNLLQDVTVPVLIHCFTGTLAECRAYVDRGYFISLSGYLFKPEATEARECLRQNIISLDRLMIETDAPYMGFAGCRDNYIDKHAAYVESLNSKKRKRLVNSTYPNVPSALPMVLDKVLEEINLGRSARGEDLLLTRDELAQATTQTANQFFQLQLNLSCS